MKVYIVKEYLVEYDDNDYEVTGRFENEMHIFTNLEEAKQQAVNKIRTLLKLYKDDFINQFSCSHPKANNWTLEQLAIEKMINVLIISVFEKKETETEFQLTENLKINKDDYEWV